MSQRREPVIGKLVFQCLELKIVSDLLVSFAPSPPLTALSF